MLDKIMDMLPGSFDLDELAGSVGMTADEVKNGGEALFSKLKDGSLDSVDAVKEVAAETGLDPEKLQGLLPALAEKAGLDGESGLMEKLGGEDGLLGKVGGFLDRDGDGNPLNDIGDMAKGLFGKK